VLGRLGLDLAGRLDEGDVDEVDEDHVVAADLMAQLPDRLHEGQALDVADRAADLADHHVDIGAAERADGVLDLVGDVRDDLHRAAVVLAGALLLDHRLVDPARGDRRMLGAGHAEEALVVAEVEIGLGAVIGDVDLAVLERVHGPGIDVEVRVELLDLDPVAHVDEQPPERRRGDALAERADHPAGDEDVPGRTFAFAELDMGASRDEVAGQAGGTPGLSSGRDHSGRRSMAARQLVGAPARQEGIVVGARIDARRGVRDHAAGDADAGLERAQLLELLAALEAAVPAGAQ
jgi:hypothetical protein